MKIPDSPRVERSLNIARGFIQHYQINQLPVNPLHIINKNRDWEIRTIREILTYDETYAMDSDDAETVYLSGKNKIDKYLIIYNDKIKTPERIMWTIMHEIAHIVLGHLRDFEKTKMSRYSLTKLELKVLEREADIFTAEVMAPLSILKALEVSNYLDIVRYCHISKEAAKNRINDIMWHGDKKVYSIADPFYYKQFQQYLHRLKIHAKKRTSFRDYFNLFSTSINDIFISEVEHCSHCGNNMISRFTIFCPICGEPIKSKKQGDFPFKYKSIPLSFAKQAERCPRCNNEEIDDCGPYCKTCGTYLLQRCTNENCKHSKATLESLLSGNSRFCDICGEQTTFYKNSLLRNWQDEKRELEENIAF